MDIGEKKITFNIFEIGVGKPANDLFALRYVPHAHKLNESTRVLLYDTIEASRVGVEIKFIQNGMRVVVLAGRCGAIARFFVHVPIADEAIAREHWKYVQEFVANIGANVLQITHKKRKQIDGDKARIQKCAQRQTLVKALGRQ